MPGVYTLYDVTSAVHTALDTGVLDVSGWDELVIYAEASGAAALALKGYLVDDTGTSKGPIFTTANNPSLMGWGPGVILTPDVQVPNVQQYLPLPRRVRFTLDAIVAQTGRIRIEGRLAS